MAYKPAAPCLFDAKTKVFGKPFHHIVAPFINFLINIVLFNQFDFNVYFRAGSFQRIDIILNLLTRGETEMSKADEDMNRFHSLDVCDTADEIIKMKQERIKASLSMQFQYMQSLYILLRLVMLEIQSIREYTIGVINYKDDTAAPFNNLKGYTQYTYGFTHVSDEYVNLITFDVKLLFELYNSLFLVKKKIYVTINNVFEEYMINLDLLTTHVNNDFIGSTDKINLLTDEFYAVNYRRYNLDNCKLIGEISFGGTHKYTMSQESYDNDLAVRGIIREIKDLPAPERTNNKRDRDSINEEKQTTAIKRT